MGENAALLKWNYCKQKRLSKKQQFFVVELNHC